MVPGVVESVRLITRPAAERIVRFAFELARQGGRRLVTFCHKADVMRLSDGLFLECARCVADEYPFIQFEEKTIDNVCLELARDPSEYDVLVMENLFGDVISDLAAGLVGGLGVVPGANLGTRYAVFEAVHGSAPDIAGKGLANPTALLLSAVLMLRHIDETAAAEGIMAGLGAVLKKGKTLTRDLGGTASTREFADAVSLAVAG